jgi:quinol monooxygenase YgiN
MFLSMVKISPVPGREQEILDILLSVRGPTLADAGCLECCILEEHDDENVIVYLEKWESGAELCNHIRSAIYSRVLKALELSDREPEICFHEITATQGMEVIERLRSSAAGNLPLMKKPMGPGGKLKGKEKGNEMDE